MHDFVEVFAPLYTAMTAQQRSWSPRHVHLMEMLFKVVKCVALHHSVPPSPDFVALLENDLMSRALVCETDQSSSKKPKVF